MIGYNNKSSRETLMFSEDRAKNGMIVERERGVNLRVEVRNEEFGE